MAKAKLKLEDIVAIVTGEGEPIYKFARVVQALRDAGLMPVRRGRQGPRPGEAAQRRMFAKQEADRVRREEEEAAVKDPKPKPIEPIFFDGDPAAVEGDDVLEEQEQEEQE
jgi:hypothetical protein